jgi:hypothetical protein
MRIWSIHPKYLDAQGLVALWREALLAQAVLKGRTIGYRHHPQLLRFSEQTSPIAAIAEYLRGVHAEATRRGYQFAAAKIDRATGLGQLTVTRGQIQLEWHHLLGKLRRRDPEWHARVATVTNPRPHPLFRVVRGRVAPWERTSALASKPSQRTRRKRHAGER